jgi:hypothetical protein
MKVGTKLEKQLEEFDKFYPSDDLYKLCDGKKLPKKIYKQMWKEYEQFNFNTIRNKLRKKQSQFKNFAKKCTGLTFKQFSIESVDQKTSRTQERGYDRLGVNLWNTGKQNLGFYGNYIEEVHYSFSSDHTPFYNPKTKEFFIWFQAGIGYTHLGGGHNGVSDTNDTTKAWYVFYNINKNVMTFSKKLPYKIREWGEV